MKTRIGFGIVALFVAVSLLVMIRPVAARVDPSGFDAASGPAQTAPVPEVHATLAQLPLYFIENRGQVDQQVAYYVKGKDKTLYFTSQGVTFVLHGPNTQDAELSHEFPPVPSSRWIVKLDFVGANPDVQPQGEDDTGAVISYFKGRPDQWVTGLRTYSRVVYRDLWPGIDLEYSGTVNRLKYQFVVHPGADPRDIRLAYHGATEVAVDEAGRLQVSTRVGGFEDDAPYAYQQDERGEKAEVAVSYEFLPSSHEQYLYGFRVGEYDRSRPLVLDPAVLVYCGYIGGSGDEHGQGIAVDGSGHAYVVGFTTSDETEGFPLAVGPYLTHGGRWDVFVAKVRTDGTGLVYCGYFGGSEDDYGQGIAVDTSGNAYVTGHTFSTVAMGFPVLVGPALTKDGFAADGFVAKVRPDGAALLYCGYIGGSRADAGYAIAVDTSGHAFVAGNTGSTKQEGFPVAVGPDLGYNGGNYDAFVARVRADGSALDYCGYIGGSDEDNGHGIALDRSGNAYVSGDTRSDETTFPEIVGPDLKHNGGWDAFVAKVRVDGTALEYCGYIGGSGRDQGKAIAVDRDGSAYVTGRTASGAATFPETGGPDLSHNGLTDAFVAKVKASGTGLAYCGYIGGSEEDYGHGIALDGSRNAYVTGETQSSEATFPVLMGPDGSHNGGKDAFVARVKADGTALDYCGYIGGAEDDHGQGIAVDSLDSAYVVGRAQSTQASFPVIVGPDLTYNAGFYDAFVAKISNSPQVQVGKTLVHPLDVSASVSDTITFTIHITSTSLTPIDTLPLYDYHCPACLEYSSSDVAPTWVSDTLGIIHWLDLLDPAAGGPGTLDPGESLALTVGFHGVVQDTMYWKEAGWLDYAPKGMPDFDQRQHEWGYREGEEWVWFYCGPVAVANSLWWFDSKFEPNPMPPLEINDGYPLVTNGGSPIDDHDPRNVQPLAGTLGTLMGTTPSKGTSVLDLEKGVQQYIDDQGLADEYRLHAEPKPEFDWLVGEVRRSEDVILLLGFWQEVAPNSWERRGGHYVTVAGIDSKNSLIAFSDPYFDRAEHGGKGRVLPNPHADLHPPGPRDEWHNDAKYASHDVYTYGDHHSPAASWGLLDYAVGCADVRNFEGQNEGDYANTGSCRTDLPIVTEVEYAVAVSPITRTILCKPTDNFAVVSGAKDVHGIVVPEAQGHAQVKVNARPALGTITPSSGSGSAGVTTYFSTTWQDDNGWRDLKQCYFHIGESAALAGNVTVMYNAAKDKLWMLADDGATWLGGYAPGSANSIENSQAILSCTLTTVEGAGDTLSVAWAIEFKTAFAGAKRTGLKCKDRTKARAKAKWKGTWTITP